MNYAQSFFDWSVESEKDWKNIEASNIQKMVIS